LEFSPLHRIPIGHYRRIWAGLPLLEIERELARRRQLSNLKKGEEAPVPQNFGERGEAAEIVAGKIGVSDELIRQALWLRENAPEEELEKLRL
jgi:hypothetical protein